MLSARADADRDGSRFRLGVAQFNQREFWDAHESWEGIWLASEGARKQFLQGLIQLAAACYHLERNNQRGARRLLELAGEKLRPLPAGFGGIALDALLREADALLDSDRDRLVFPSIRHLEQ